MKTVLEYRIKLIDKQFPWFAKWRLENPNIVGTLGQVKVARIDLELCQQTPTRLRSIFLFNGLGEFVSTVGLGVKRKSLVCRLFDALSLDFDPLAMDWDQTVEKEVIRLLWQKACEYKMGYASWVDPYYVVVCERSHECADTEVTIYKPKGESLKGWLEEMRVAQEVDMKNTLAAIG